MAASVLLDTWQCQLKSCPRPESLCVHAPWPWVWVALEGGPAVVCQEPRAGLAEAVLMCPTPESSKVARILGQRVTSLPAVRSPVGLLGGKGSAVAPGEPGGQELPPTGLGGWAAPMQAGAFVLGQAQSSTQRLHPGFPACKNHPKSGKLQRHLVCGNPSVRWGLLTQVEVGKGFSRRKRGGAASLGTVGAGRRGHRSHCSGRWGLRTAVLHDLPGQGPPSAQELGDVLVGRAPVLTLGTSCVPSNLPPPHPPP